VSAESCLGGGVYVMFFCVGGESLVDYCHKQFCERWCDGYGSVIVIIIWVSFLFV
jgi:hypothetical protein